MSWNIFWLTVAKWSNSATRCSTTPENKAIPLLKDQRKPRERRSITYKIYCNSRSFNPRDGQLGWNFHDNKNLNSPKLKIILVDNNYDLSLSNLLGISSLKRV